MTFPLPPNEELRLAELRRFAVLDTPPEKAFDNITEIAARIFRVPIASVTLIDEDRQWFKSCLGLDTRGGGRDIAFCAYAILDSEVMIVPDAREDARFADNPLVKGEPYIRFYAGAPLRTVNGLNLGTLCIIDKKPRNLSRRSISTLVSLATLVVDEIQLRYEIGERRRTTETLRLLQAAMQQSSESVIITTADIESPGPEIIFVNPAFTKLTGYEPEEVIGKTPRVLHGPATDRSVLDSVRTQMQEGEEFDFRTVNYRKDGSEFVISCHIAPICGEDGTRTHFICTQHDATESDRVAAALQLAKQEAERASRAKSDFLSRMSHELRTPLHAILGFAQLLENEDQKAEDAEGVAQIVGAGKHLLCLIDEVLDVAQVESGSLTLTLGPVDVLEALEEMLSLMKPMAAVRDVQLLPISGDYHREVLSSGQQFRQILLNLLSNAVKYNRSGGTVGVACTTIDDCLRISITDTGHGIAAENFPKLFLPFERLEYRGSVIEGAGLGLSLTKRLVDAMGGRVGVESVLEEGTTFWVELPLASQISTDPRPRDVAKMGGCNGTLQPVIPRTLLYIEDNLSNLRLVERILARRPEVKLISAMQGSIGLELIRQHQPDLVLLDLHLPDIQGDEILRQLRADPRTEQLRVVMISADAIPSQIDRLRAASADGYLTKPIDVRKFLALVDATAASHVDRSSPRSVVTRS